MAERQIASPVQAGDCIVVYSTATGRVRRWLASNRDGEIRKVDVQPGEDVIHVGKQRGLSLPLLQGLVNDVTGKIPTNDRYCVVQGEKITNVIIADPLCGDAIAGCELIQHDSADSRWTFDSTTRTFIPPPAQNPRPVRSRET